MKKYSLETLRSVLAAPFINLPEGKSDWCPRDILINAISTDTRDLKPGSLFVPLIGERFDGHDYLATAEARGAVAVLSQYSEAVKKQQLTVPVILVDDTLNGYRRLAAWYRNQLAGQVIAVSGSVGKTSTRDMIVAALGRMLKVEHTRANLNNEIGLSGTILATSEESDALVVEAGIDGPNQMNRLAEVAQPNIAVLTMIGHTHIAQFKTVEGITEEKCKLMNFVKTGGWALLNGDDPQLCRFLTTWEKSNDLHLGLVCLGDTIDQSLVGSLHDCSVTVLRGAALDQTAVGTTFDVYLHQDGDQKGKKLGRVRLTTPGVHHVCNALFGLFCGHILGLDFADTAAGLMDYKATGSRQRIVKSNSVTVVDDSYNASEESMSAGFNLVSTLAENTGGRFIAALGGINELGDYSAEIHYRIGTELYAHHPAAIFLLGDATAELAAGYRAAAARAEGGNQLNEDDQHSKQSESLQFFTDVHALSEAIKPILKPGDVLFVKGSHSFGMEFISEDVISFLNTDFAGVDNFSKNEDVDPISAHRIEQEH
ncbi:MAG: UDP-N-acetylmuramoyl-tripeptide--D-alanyl-D-alanine ligase [Fastidiosipilaceae bacterium]